MTSKPSLISASAASNVPCMSGYSSGGGPSTSSLTRFQPPASRARRSVRTASLAVKQPAVFGREVIFFGSTWSCNIGALGSDRLTRRTATVTISAPLASIAAAVSSRSLYLPVPTISRERNRRPATSQPSSASKVIAGSFAKALSRAGSGGTKSSFTPLMFASSDEVHDFELVSRLEPSLAIDGAGHDFLVALDRHFTGIKPDELQEGSHRHGGGKIPRFTIHHNAQTI